MARQNNNFIPCHARNGVSGAQCRLHLLSGMAQHLITHGMAIAVIDVLESIQIQQDDGHVFTTAIGRLHQPCEFMHKPCAVGQARQRIPVRHDLQLVLTLFLLRDIGKHAHVMRCLAARVVHCVQGHALGEHFPILAFVPDLSAPVACAVQAGPHVVVKVFRMLA